MYCSLVLQPEFSQSTALEFQFRPLPFIAKLHHCSRPDSFRVVFAIRPPAFISRTSWQTHYTMDWTILVCTLLDPTDKPQVETLTSLDRDLLGYTSSRARPPGDMSSHRYAIKYFPTPSSSRMSQTQNRRDSYYEASLPSSPTFESNLLMTPMESKEACHFTDPTTAFGREQKGFGFEPRSTWQPKTSSLHFGSIDDYPSYEALC